MSLHRGTKFPVSSQKSCFNHRGAMLLHRAYKVYWSSCVKGVHSGKMVLPQVDAIDVYLECVYMYGLFISNAPHDMSPSVDRSLFGMFALGYGRDPPLTL
ncbi:hypothetical protein MTR_3g032170 [Medicago truncatula]|uniref:Uncharacterized protein n=2 Tax=Medicago truncatula TaxID=3880 RepID=G7IWZ6_MEDTR|nr:hypothetical protein MTR_3g032170 [Medicago truncatula]